MRERGGGPTNRVLEARELLGWTQRDLANRAGITGPAVHYIEHGQSPGDPQTRVAIAEALGLPYERVFPLDPIEERNA